MAISIRLNNREIDRLLKGDTGPVAKRLLRIGYKIEKGAKRRCPVDTGRLRSSIHTEESNTSSGAPLVRVGTNVEYAIYIHDGTGVLGPRGVPITPVSSSVLVWTDKKGNTVFAKSVRGMKPRPFLKNALDDVR